MFGLTVEKLLIIGVIAAFLIGPDKLPAYSAKLANLVRSVRDMARGAQSRLKEDMGPEYDEVDWRKLDPRQYDPRRIIRDALLEEETPPRAPTRPSGVGPSGIGPDARVDEETRAADAARREAVRRRLSGQADGSVPFDDEAT